MSDTPTMPELPEPIGHIHSNGDFCQDRAIVGNPLWPADVFLAADLHEAYHLGVEAGTPKWLPIESAPKDGTAILVCLSDSDSGYVVFWVDPAKGIRDYVGSKIGWHIAYCGDFLGPCDAPTHWQPLPKGPKDV